MPKRKWSEYRANDTEVGDIHVARRKQIENEIAYGKQELNRALKLVRGLERQKLGRRLKVATQNKEKAQVVRIENEIQALKELDFSVAAERHLHKVLLRVKTIATSPSLPLAVTVGNIAPQNAAASNVTARLYNTSEMKEIIDRVIKNIRQILHLDQDPEPENSKSGTSERALQNKSQQLLSTQSDSAVDPKSTKKPGIFDKDGLKADQDDSSDAGSDSGGEELFKVNTMLASPEEDSGEDDEEDDEEEGFDDSSLQRAAESQLKAELAESVSAATGEMGQNASNSLSPDANATHNKTKEQQAGSTFLPSLTMGGYWSGSESAASELSDSEMAPRKNRRGQRARQAIWKQKYGKKAKHLNDGKPSGGRDDGWDSKRGAVSGDHVTDVGRNKRINAGSKSGGETNFIPLGSHKTPLQKSRRDDQGPLHPSWTAAKIAKEKKQTSSFQGKKITFD